MINKATEILQKFNDRYYKKYHDDIGIIDRIEFSYDGIVEHDWRVSVHIDTDDYWLHVYLNEGTDELVIYNDRMEDIIDYAEEREWSEIDVSWIKFGKIKDVKYLPDEFKFNSNINPFDETYLAQKTDRGENMAYHFKSLQWTGNNSNTTTANVEIKIGFFYAYMVFSVTQTNDMKWHFVNFIENEMEGEIVASMEDGKRKAEEKYQAIMNDLVKSIEKMKV